MNEFKKSFPFFENNKSTIYFDSAATTLKPSVVIETEKEFMTSNGTNPHATDYAKGFESYEIINDTRQLVKQYIKADKKEEIIFTSGTTHSINLLANGIENLINHNDEIWVTELEHSANLIPWIKLANKKQAIIKKIPLKDNFEIDIKSLKSLINKNTKIITFASNYNTVGTKNNVGLITKVIREINNDIIIHIDAAQTIGHSKVDIKDWNVDFISWSAHKMFGPFGLGVLYGKYDQLDKLEPLFFGGGMSVSVNQDLTDYKLSTLPEKLEGGTPNISAIVAYKSAINFVNKIGIENIEKHEKELKNYFVKNIKNTQLFDKITFYNLSTDSPMILFNVNNANPQDITTFLDRKFNISVRGGANCARRTEGVIGLKIAIRASFSIYNSFEEIDKFIEALKVCDQYLDAIF